mmetsp:Transcript_13149/g.39792  ORF Transcript_13149/g.39792 Transcript_13149/m.39792 type:complete len:646 (-) Transcript_13149:1186-3123(-)
MEEKDLGTHVPVEDPGELRPWSSDPRYPTEVDGYDMQKQVGVGQTAAVWAARVHDSGATVAVKVFNLAYLKGDKGRAVQEVVTQRALRHDCILPVLAYFEHQDALYMVLPFLNGGSVSDIIKHRHPQGLSEDAILAIAQPVLRALQFMHNRGVMHRDIKAANVLVNEEGHVFLADFGVVAPTEHVSGPSSKGGEERKRLLARHRAALSDFVGTPAWMAPEVVAPDEEVGYDERADIWSFGILLLEMAQGEVPHAEDSLTDIVVAIANDEPPKLEAPCDDRQFCEEFKQLICRCLRKDPAQRATATQLLLDPVLKDVISAQKLMHLLFTTEHHHHLHKLSRIPSRSKSMRKKDLDSMLREEVESALEVLRRSAVPVSLPGGESDSDSGSGREDAAGGKERHKKHRLHPHLRRTHPVDRLTHQDLVNCKGLIFARACKHGSVVRSSARGTGFAVARLQDSSGHVFWSAPSFVQVVGNGVGIALGGEELSFILVLRDMEHLMTAASSHAAVKANVSSSITGHKVAFQLRLGNAVHTAKLLSFSHGRMLDMSIMGWDCGPDDEFNERVYDGPVEASQLLTGGKRPPSQFDDLMDELQRLEQGGLPDLKQKSEHTLHKMAPEALPNGDVAAATAHAPPLAVDDCRAASFS